jgi:hypothetical protein
MTNALAGGIDGETGSLLLVGDAGAFAWISRRLRDSEPITVDLEPVTGWPAIDSITSLAITPANHMATIHLEHGSATLSGDRESLTRLADELDLFVEHNDLNEPGMHAHLDSASWSAGQALFAPDSLGLIVAGPAPDS